MAVLKANLNLSSFPENSPKKANIADRSYTPHLTDVKKSYRNTILTSAKGNLCLAHVNGLPHIFAGSLLHWTSLSDRLLASSDY